MLLQNKTVGALTFLSGLIAIASLLFSAIFVNYHFEAFNDPSIILSLPHVDAEAGKWSMICDMLGYYMLLLPLMFYIHDWMKGKTSWSSTITFCGLAYVLIGSIGASILAVVWPNAVHAYPTASPVEQSIIRANFNLANTMVYDGMWNLLEQLFAGIWWLATGVFLFKNQIKGVALLAIIAGASSLLDPLATMISSNALHQLALNIYLYAAVVWAIWTGIAVYRKPLLTANSADIKASLRRRNAASLSSTAV